MKFNANEIFLHVALSLISVPFQLAKMVAEIASQNYETEDDIHLQSLTTEDESQATIESCNETESNTTTSSGYDTDDKWILDIIETPPGVKNHVIIYRRGHVKKIQKYFEQYCGWSRKQTIALSVLSYTSLVNKLEYYVYVFLG